MKNSNLNSVLDQTYRKKTRKCCDVISGKVYSVRFPGKNKMENSTFIKCSTENGIKKSQALVLS